MLGGDPRGEGAAWFAQREAERPDLPGDAQILWAAFCALQGDRPMVASMAGAAAGAIPYTAFREWAADNGFAPGGEDFEWLRAGLDELMAVQMKHEADERGKAETNKPKR